MSLLSGLQSGLQSGIRSGLNPSIGGATWSTDATSSKALPSSGAEAASLLAAAGISATTLGLWLPGSPASGDISDVSGNSKTLTAGGSNGANIAYQQNVTGWTAKAMVPTSGAIGRFDNNTFPNVNASTPTLILYAELVAAGTLRTIARYGTLYDDDCTFDETAAPVISCGEGDGTRTAGASNPTGAVRPFAMSMGASVILASDQETIAVGAKAANGTMLTLGGDNSDTNFPNNTKYVLAWLIDAALSSAQIKTLFQTMGWTIPW